MACLCAAWCRLCDDYQPVVTRIVDELAATGVAVTLHWIDIEDEADLIGDIDVENFPTLVVADRDRVRFAGTVTPQPETLRRLLRATVVDAGATPVWPEPAEGFAEFTARLWQRVEDPA